MPIKRGGQTRSNAGRYAPEGQGATQRGGRTRTPSGNARPTQTARLPRANMPGTVTPSGAARSPQRSGLSIIGDVANVINAVRRYGPLAAAYEVSKPRGLASGELSAEMQKKMQETRERISREPKNLPRNPQEGMTRAQSFDAAFAEARKAGQKQFDWRGRTYTTKMK